jgi:hypothetical protein
MDHEKLVRVYWCEQDSCYYNENGLNYSPIKDNDNYTKET